MTKLDKLTEQAQGHLEAGEHIIAAVQGTYETKVMGGDRVRPGVLIATDRRVVFYAKKLGGYDLESFPYAHISSFEQGKNMMGHTVTFFASGNRVSMQWIKDGMDAFTETVRHQMSTGHEAPQPQPASVDVFERLRRLGELRDAGVVTPVEFEAKKAELLARM